MKRRIVAGCLILTALATTGCFNKNNDPVIAKVGRSTITLSDLNEKINSYPPQIRQALEQQDNKVKVLDLMIDELVLYNEAKRDGYTKKEEFKKRIDKAQKDILVEMIVRDNIDSGIEVTEDDAQNFYRNNPDQFKRLERRRVRHILVNSQDKAEEIRSQIRAGRVSFADAAKANSLDPSAQNGGDIGYFVKGQLVPEFEEVAFALKTPGAISLPFKTNLGYHIVMLEDVNVRPQLSYNDVKDTIKTSLTQQRKQEKSKSYLDKLKEKQKVVRDIKKLNPEQPLKK